MKKVLTIIGVGFAILLGICIIIADNDKKARGPEQTFVIYNSGAKEVSVTFHELNEDNTYGGYLDNIIVKPDEAKYKLYTKGTYKINVWDGNVEDDETEKLRSINDIKVVLADNKDNYNPIYIDTTGENYFAIVDVNFIYSGSSLANSLSESFGTSRAKPVVKKLYNGSKPFCVPEFYTKGTFVGPGDKLPKEISYGTVVYALIPIPNTVKKADEVLKHIYLFIQTHIET